MRNERDPQGVVVVVRTLLHSVYDQPDASSVNAQYDRVLQARVDKLSAVADHRHLPP